MVSGGFMADTEKITINLSAVDLGRIDLLAEDGFYSNRTDFIRAAIRKELEAQSGVVEKGVARRASTLGLALVTRRSLEKCLERKEKLELNVVGGVFLSDDITPDLAKETIQSLKVYGVLRASQAVKDALADRIR
jgi:Arc/MetJ-type ribon-helix-helix transcriptional regulator